jgi:hypothetical protein
MPNQTNSILSDRGVENFLPDERQAFVSLVSTLLGFS